MRTNFTMSDKYIRMTRGDTLSFNFQVYDTHGDPFSEYLHTAYFTVRSNRSDGRQVFQKSLWNGISTVGNGLYVVRVAPEDTKDVKPGKYFYDLQIELHGDVYTVMKGVLEIEPDVTQY